MWQLPKCCSACFSSLLASGFSSNTEPAHHSNLLYAYNALSKFLLICIKDSTDISSRIACLVFLVLPVDSHHPKQLYANCMTNFLSWNDRQSRTGCNSIHGFVSEIFLQHWLILQLYGQLGREDLDNLCFHLSPNQSNAVRVFCVTCTLMRE